MKRYFFIIILISSLTVSLNASIKLFYNQFSESLTLTSSWKNTKIIKQKSNIDLKFIKTSFLAFWNGKSNGFLKFFIIVKPTLNKEENWYIHTSNKNIQKKLIPYNEEKFNWLYKNIKQGEQVWSVSFCLDEILEIKKLYEESKKKEVNFYISNLKEETIYFVWKDYSNLNKFLKELFSILP